MSPAMNAPAKSRPLSTRMLIASSVGLVGLSRPS